MTAKEKTLVAVIGAGLAVGFTSGVIIAFDKGKLTDNKKKTLKGAVAVGLIGASAGLFYYNHLQK